MSDINPVRDTCIKSKYLNSMFQFFKNALFLIHFDNAFFKIHNYGEKKGNCVCITAFSDNILKQNNDMEQEK